ncbi:aminoglycoside phosphotransferase family protein [Halomonas garicola]|uniref:aminoglycoside phosphotransferase family protein n=1 Tax=Halomonas garicola TaxID=1690008 RepID=UPI0028997241|nr:aminoglycoside phosphotransferase family protein [Halomonas garicola]
MTIAIKPLEAALEHAGIAWHHLEPMADTGLAHDHVWLRDDGVDDRVIRLPKPGRLDSTPEARLAHQAACYRRAAESGHAPHLHAVLPPDDHLPQGGLVVDAVLGRPAALPDDLPRIAAALAALHNLALPAPEHRPPLPAPANPWRALYREIAEQSLFVDTAQLPDAVSRRIHRAFKALPTKLYYATPCLISLAAHPSNFLIDERGRALFLNLDSCRYGLAGFDLAHASLATSTPWDTASYAVLTPEDVADFYQRWQRKMSATQGENIPSVETLLACRRAMWLRSLTWCAKWRTQRLQARGSPHDPAQGEDVRDRVEHYLSLPAIDAAENELAYLDDVLY